MGCSTLLGPGAPSGAPSATARPPLQRPVDHVILVVLDGVRPNELLAGVDPDLGREAGVPERPAAELVPHLTALVERGVLIGTPEGAPFVASGPNYVSLPGYTELLSGRTATCQENDCAGPPPARTIIDRVCDASGPERCRAALFSSWQSLERISAVDRGRAVVSAGRTGGEQHERLAEDPLTEALYLRGRAASPEPGWGSYRPDRDTAALALAYLGANRPRFTFVSLGDTDELAHAGDYAGYLGALERADAFIGAVDDLARTWTQEGAPTVVIVTTDHGRADNFRDHGREHPESARGWLAAAGPNIRRAGALALAETRRGRDVAATIAHLLGVPPEIDARSGQAIDEIIDADGYVIAPVRRARDRRAHVVSGGRRL